MTYRIYLRNNAQQVTDKTVTESSKVAAAAFDELVNRVDLDGMAFLAVLNRDGKPVAHHDFKSQPGDALFWRHRMEQIRFS